MNQTIAIASMGMPGTGLPVGVSVPVGGDFSALLSALADGNEKKGQQSADVLRLLAGLIPAAVLQGLQSSAEQYADGVQANPVASIDGAVLQGVQANPVASVDGAPLQSAQMNPLGSADILALLHELLQSGTVDAQTGQALEALVAAPQEQGGGDIAAMIRAALDALLPAGEQVQTGPGQIAVTTNSEDGLAVTAPLLPVAQRQQTAEPVQPDAVPQPSQAAPEDGEKGTTGIAFVINDDVSQAEDSSPVTGTTATAAAPSQLMPQTMEAPPSAALGFAPTWQTETAPPPESDMQTMEVRSGGEIYDKLVDRVVSMRAGNRDQMVIQLKPEALGRLTIRLSLDETGLVAHIAAANPRVQQQLSAQAGGLQATLSDQGLKDVRVIVTATGVAQAGFDQGFGSHGHGQQNAPRHRWSDLFAPTDAAPAAQLFQAYEHAGRPSTVNKLA